MGAYFAKVANIKKRGIILGVGAGRSENAKRGQGVSAVAWRLEVKGSKQE